MSTPLNGTSITNSSSLIARFVMALIDAKTLPTLDVLIFCSLIHQSLNLEASVMGYLSKFLIPRVVTKYLTFRLAALKNKSLLPTPLMSRCRFSASSIVDISAMTDKGSFNKCEAEIFESLLRSLKQWSSSLARTAMEAC